MAVVQVRTRRAQALEPATAAWVLAAPCALIAVAAIAWLGPPLGNAFLAPTGTEAFWPEAWREPEPVEHARYLLALLAPALLAAGVLASGAARMTLPAAVARWLVVATQLALTAFLALCLLAQNQVLFHSYVTDPRLRPFTLPALLAAGALTLVGAVLLQRPRTRERVRTLARETRGRRLACPAAAALLTAVWLLTAVDTDATVGNSLAAHLLPWTANETFAVLDGRTPLVDFHAQYGQLSSYLSAGVAALLGTSMTVWTTAMATLSGAALLAVYALLRRVVRSSTFALALYAPLLATSCYFLLHVDARRFSSMGIFSVWPARYAWAFLLAWLTARHLDRAAPRGVLVLSLAGGLVAINNLEFGGPALLATLVALVCARPPRSRRAAGRLLLAVAGGFAGALAATTLVTLLRAGALPRLGLLLEFPRLYGVGGWVLEPMPLLGLHLALYLTFAGALVTAVVRAVRGDEERLLTGMLAWSGVFGLLAGAYYVGRSEAVNLVALFPAWSLALALLLVAILRGLERRPSWRPTLAELAVLFGCVLTVTSLAQLPLPWSQIDRLGQVGPTPAFAQPQVRQLVADATSPGDEVAILAPLGHRLAYELGLDNVAPYSSVESMPTLEQVRRTVAVLRHRHVHLVFLQIFDTTPGYTLPEVIAAFNGFGFQQRAQVVSMVELSDAPAAR